MRAQSGDRGVAWGVHGVGAVARVAFGRHGVDWSTKGWKRSRESGGEEGGMVGVV